MATAQKSRTETDFIASPVPAPRNGLYLGLCLVLVLAIVNIWTYDQWAKAVPQAGILALTIAVAIRYSFTGDFPPLSWMQVPLFGAALWGLLQLGLGVSLYRFETWKAVLNWVTLGCAFSVAVAIFRNPGRRISFRIFAIWFAGFLALWALLQFFSAEGKILWFYESPNSAAPVGPFLNRDHYATFMVLLLPAVLWEALHDRRRGFLYGGIGAIMYASVIASASRAGSVLINLEFAAVLIPELIRRGRGHRRAAANTVLAVGLLFLVFAAVVGWDVLLQRFQDKDPLLGRREWITSSISMIRDRPVLGSGLGTWPTVYPGYAFFDAGLFVNANHSDWFQWAGEGGIPLAALMLAFAGRAFYLGFRMPWGLGAGFVFLHAILDFPLQLLPIFLWVVVMTAALECGHVNRLSHGE